MGLQENFLLEVLSSVSWYNHHHHKDTRTTNDIFFKDKVVKIFKWLLWLIICFQDFLKAIDELNLYTLKIRFRRIWQKFIYDVMCDVICWLVSFLSTFFYWGFRRNLSSDFPKTNEIAYLTCIIFKEFYAQKCVSVY